MIEKTFLNPTTNKQWRIEIDGHTIRTCLNVRTVTASCPWPPLPQGMTSS